MASETVCTPTQASLSALARPPAPRLPARLLIAQMQRSCVVCLCSCIFKVLMPVPPLFFSARLVSSGLCTIRFRNIILRLCCHYVLCVHELCEFNDTLLPVGASGLGWFVGSRGTPCVRYVGRSVARVGANWQDRDDFVGWPGTRSIVWLQYRHQAAVCRAPMPGQLRVFIKAQDVVPDGLSI